MKKGGEIDGIDAFMYVIEQNNIAKCIMSSSCHAQSSKNDHKTPKTLESPSLQALRVSLEHHRNLIRQRLVHRISRMQRIQPKILVHRNATARVKSSGSGGTILIRRAISRCVFVPCRLRRRVWVVQDTGEQPIGIKLEDCCILMSGLEIVGHGLDAEVEVANVRGFKGYCGLSLHSGARRTINRWDVEDEEVAGAVIIKLGGR